LLGFEGDQKFAEDDGQRVDVNLGHVVIITSAVFD
jgi:hypothetical protein